VAHRASEKSPQAAAFSQPTVQAPHWHEVRELHSVSSVQAVSQFELVPTLGVLGSGSPHAGSASSSSTTAAAQGLETKRSVGRCGRDRNRSGRTA
jgi:hypothetical protein